MLRGSFLYVLAELHQDRCDLFTGRAALRLKISLAAVARAGDQAKPDRVRHRVLRPVGHTARIRESAQVSGRPRALKFEHARHVLHEDDRDLLARHRPVRLKRRAGRAGNHAGLIGPEDGRLMLAAQLDELRVVVQVERGMLVEAAVEQPEIVEVADAVQGFGIRISEVY